MKSKQEEGTLRLAFASCGFVYVTCLEVREGVTSEAERVGAGAGAGASIDLMEDKDGLEGSGREARD